MSFSDSDWTSEAADAAQRDKGPSRVLVFAAGALLGATVAALALWAIGRTPAPAGGAAVVARHDAPLTEARPEPTAPMAPAGSAPAAEPALPALQAPRAAASIPALSQEQRRRMERAWQAFYQRPAACDHNPTPQQMIDCANHHIRTRREFEERYAAGRL
jgi:hypothetical protein